MMEKDESSQLIVYYAFKIMLIYIMTKYHSDIVLRTPSVGL